MTALFDTKAQVKKALPKMIRELPDNKLRIETYISFMGREYLAVGIYSRNTDTFLGYY